MTNSSPIETWEGASVVYTYAGSFGTHLWFWVSVALLVLTVFSAIGHQVKSEREAASRQR